MKKKTKKKQPMKIHRVFLSATTKRYLHLTEY